ncbi:MAG: CPBP family intramembrane metalloprotease [Acidobacteria bacterium]|nr:CPBP family intramembrane metalloprotease [Acidobacteriota bacterium]
MSSAEYTAPGSRSEFPDLWSLVLSSTTFRVILLLVLGLAILPLPGQWKVMQQLAPVLVIGAFYWTQKYDRERAGLGRPASGWMVTILSGLAIAAAYYLVKIVALEPILLAAFDQGKDLSLFEPIRGNLSNLLMYLVGMWIFAAFGEEFIWRGFVLREVAERSAAGPAAGLLVSAAFFGLAHAYQGVFGVVEKFIVALIFGGIYLAGGGRDIWRVVIVHGVLNSIAFIRIYLSV